MMKTTRAFAPHRMASSNAARAEDWFRVLPNRTTEKIGDHIPDWDAGTALTCERIVNFDVDSLRKTCELEPRDRIAAVAQWHSLRTALRETGKAVVVTEAENEVQVAIKIPAGLSGGTLILRTFLILESVADGDRSPLAAAKAGAILWQDKVTIALEGTGARFPVEVRKFEPGLPSGAGWMLDWRPSSPDALFMGSVRLLLNESHKAIVEATTATNRDLNQKLIVSAINADVARSLICGMLRNPDFVNGDTQFEKGTVGQVVGDLVASTFPREDLETVRSQLENEPETFAAKVQSRFKLFNVG